MNQRLIVLHVQYESVAPHRRIFVEPLGCEQNSQRNVEGTKESWWQARAHLFDRTARPEVLVEMEILEEFESQVPRLSLASAMALRPLVSFTFFELQ
jgi:hypothetical protein